MLFIFHHPNLGFAMIFMVKPGLFRSTWRITPVSKWLMTIVSKSPKWGCSTSKWPK